jgi:hypothetical protein
MLRGRAPREEPRSGESAKRMSGWAGNAPEHAGAVNPEIAHGHLQEPRVHFMGNPPLPWCRGGSSAGLQTR